MTWAILLALAFQDCRSVASIQAKCARLEKQTAPISPAKLYHGFSAQWSKDPSPEGEEEQYAEVFYLKRLGSRVEITSTSESKDWVHYINYWFDSSGRLLRIDRKLRTFYGDIEVREELYFDCAGNQLNRTIGYFEMGKDEPKTPDEAFLDEPFEIYKTYNSLPFRQLLR